MQCGIITEAVADHIKMAISKALEQVVFLVILNNTATVLARLGEDLSTLSQLTNHLLSALMCITDLNMSTPSSPTSGNMDIETSQVCEICMSNVMHLLLKDVAAAAA